MKLVLAILPLLIVGCKTAPPPVETTTVDKGYKVAYAMTKDYVERCSSGAKIRANLYTEFPEAEIVVDYIPGNSMYWTGTTVASTSSMAQEILNIKFKGITKTSTEISTHDEVSRRFVQSALAKSTKCPTADDTKK